MARPKKKQNYMGNPNLPTADAHFVYTPEMAEEMEKCANSMTYFAENFFFIIDPDRGKVLIPLFDYQYRLLKAFEDHRFNVVLSSRQSGKTTVMTILALHEACFRSYKKIVIVANKEDTAKNIFKRVKLAYEALPNWLKPGVEKWGQESLELVNGSNISISTTTGSSARGESINLLLLDELAFIEPASIVDDFWKSVVPTISRAKTSKILVTSTPNGTDNLFYRIVDEAIKKKNKFNFSRVDWWDVPGRDEEWKNEQISILGSHEAFSQEYGNEFINNGKSGIDAELFDFLSKECCEPIHILEDGHYRLWIEEPDPTRIYVAGVDVSEGVDKDASVINIFDISDPREIQQVGEYYNCNIPPAEFSNKCFEILQHWGNPIVLIERNNQGAQVCDRLAIDFGYPHIVSWGAKVAHKNQQIGMVSHTNTKAKAVQNMRYFVNEVRAVKFRNLATLQEFKNFVRYPNGTWRAASGKHDDRVMSCVWALMILFNEITESYFDIVELDEFGKPGRIEPMNLGIGLFSNPTSIYTNEQIDRIEGSNLCPIGFGGHDFVAGDVGELLANGWEFPNGVHPHQNHRYDISQHQYDLMNKYF